MKHKNDYTINSVLKAHSTKQSNDNKELSPEVLYLVEQGAFMDKYNGNDNYGKPKTDYLQKIVDMTDDQLSNECEQMIWLSAYANNNPRSDYHFMCDACYDECQRRGKGKIYTLAHKRVSSSI